MWLQRRPQLRQRTNAGRRQHASRANALRSTPPRINSTTKPRCPHAYRNNNPYTQPKNNNN
jgi:hypothetical protein